MILVRGFSRAEFIWAGFGDNFVDNAGLEFGFAVILAGRAPLVSLDPQLFMSLEVANAANHPKKQEHVLRLPTIHVQGRQDQGLHLHKRLLEQYCEERITRLIEWDGLSTYLRYSRSAAKVARLNGFVHCLLRCHDTNLL